MTEVERCRPWIEAALEHSIGTHSFADIEAGIAEGRMQLWPAPRGCMVTELISYPQRKVINLFLAGGELDQLYDMERDMAAWAKAQGCDGAMLSGRKGWARRLPGWKEQWITLVKDF